MTAALGDVLAALDRAVTGPVVVFGSVPPEARDLDLVVPDRALGDVEALLQSEGFTHRGDMWARFVGGGAIAVEVLAVSRWALAGDEAERVFDEAEALPGFRHVSVPSAHHRLLILARRVAAGTPVDQKRRRAIDDVVRAAPGAWATARSRAPDWAATAAVDVLERSYHGGARPRRWRRFAALAELERAAKRPLPRIRAARRVAPRHRRRPRVIAVSGLDGAGKSTQAGLLQAGLESLGYDTAIEWSRLTFNPSLEHIARPVKRLLRRQPSGPASSRGWSAGAAADRGFLTGAGWAIIVAIANGLTHRRVVRRHHGRAVVVCDRYVLDSCVALRDLYAGGRPLPFHRLLVRVLSPRPEAAYLLAVSAAEAHARKPEGWSVGALARHAALYEEEAAILGVTRLDGSRPASDLADEIGRAAWRALMDG